jgi:GT2 family glycosyltransferase
MHEVDLLAKKKVAVVVLNWNGGEDTLDCIRSLQRLDYPDYEIIVVDNASTDGSPQTIRREFPRLALVENDRNLGFAEGNNIGIRIALNKGSGYVLLLNNDTVVDPEILNVLVEAAEKDATIGFLGPKIYYHSEPRKIWFAGGVVDWRNGRAVHLGMGEEDVGQFGQQAEVDYITGCALFFRAEVCEKVGLMDSRFFLYYEETDWCARAKRAGYRIVFVPTAKVWHKISVSTGGAESAVGYYYYARNKLLLARRNLPFGKWLVFLFYYSYDFLLMGSLHLLKTPSRDKWRKLKALWTGFLHYWGGILGQGPLWLSGGD